jgi:probable HAF family extracellular repeat protein
MDINTEFPAMNKSLTFLPLFFVLWCVPATAQIISYHITDLGTLGGTSSEAEGINHGGQVVGNADLPGDESQHAFLYNGSTMTDLGTLGGTWSEALAVNPTGQAAGFATVTDDAAVHAFFYNGSAMTDLGTFGGTESAASAINAGGQVAGYATTTDNAAVHAFLYSGSTLADLGTLGGTNSEALGVNDAGKVVGRSMIAGATFWHAFLYADSTMTDLGTLGGSGSRANAINTLGQIAGQSSLPENLANHAFLYYGSTMTDLGTLPGTDSSEALALNNFGYVVGYAKTADETHYSAFIHNGVTMMDLNTMIPAASGWTLSLASGINDAGQIVGCGDHNGSPRAFLLDPVVNATWTAAGSGSWAVANNWNINLVPKSTGDTATFANSIGSGGAIITLDGNRTLSSLTFHNTLGGEYTIGPGTTIPGSTLYLVGGEAPASLSVSAGSHTIGTPVVLQSNLSLDVAEGADLAISGKIEESGPPRWLNKTGGGTLLLTNLIGYSDVTVVNGGKLIIAGGIDPQATSLFMVLSGTVELTVTNVTKGDLNIYTSYGAAFQVDSGNHQVGEISGYGATMVSAGTLSAERIQQETLSINGGASVIIRPQEGAPLSPRSESSPVLEPSCFLLLSMASVGLLTRMLFASRS